MAPMSYTVKIAGAAIALMLALVVHVTGSRGAAPQSNANYTITSTVDLVMLDVSVLGKNGGFRSGLEKDNFRVFENGQLQQINSFHPQDQPISIGLVIDNSRSMRPKRAEVTGAALALVRASNSQDEVFIVNFNEKVEMGLAAGKIFTHDLAELETSITRTRADGMTALYDAIAAGIDHLKAAHFERRALVIISDGRDNASHISLRQLSDMVQQSNVGLYTVALPDPDDPEQNTKILKRLSAASGGKFFSPPSVAEVVKVCQTIAKDIRARYTLSYTPANRTRDGSYRKIRVTVITQERENLSILTRPGYRAPSDAMAGNVTRKPGH